MFLSNKYYDFLKFLAQYVLPGLATLYFVLADIWSLPNSEQVVGTIVAINVFLGTVLGLSTMNYEEYKHNKEVVANVFEKAGFRFPLGFSEDGDRVDTSSTNEKDYFLKLSGSTYDILKWSVLVLLPAIGTLYFAVSQIWGFPDSDKIVGSLAAVSTFLGLFIGVNKIQYKTK